MHARANVTINAFLIFALTQLHWAVTRAYLTMATATGSITEQGNIPEKPHQQVNYKFSNANLGKEKARGKDVMSLIN